jgi:excinuclease UvrABC nuclease subunit
MINEVDYLSDINMSMKFLDGKNNEVIDTLILKMEESSG